VSDKKVLIIDDSKFVVQYISNILTAADYQVVTADNSKDGIRMVKEERPDLILLDVILPDTNGFEVFRILRDDENNYLTPVIMLTSQDNLEDKLTALELGADDYITKPFNSREMLSRIRNTLKRIDRNRYANPLTGLRGNLNIQSEINYRIVNKKLFAVIYADLDNFKPFNDVYGFGRGDDAIKLVADIIVAQIKKYGTTEDFIGHIGGDDFVIITEPDKTDIICQNIIEMFDNKIQTLYNQVDLEKGYILGCNRQGEQIKYSVMTISLAVITNQYRSFYSHIEVAEIAAELKHKAKALPGSVYVKDLRRYDQRVEQSLHND